MEGSVVVARPGETTDLGVREKCENLLGAAAWIRRFFAKIPLDRVVVGVNGEMGGVIQYGSQVSRDASLKHGCLNV